MHVLLMKILLIWACAVAGLAPAMLVHQPAPIGIRVTDTPVAHP